MDSRVIPRKCVTSPTLGPPPLCKQAQSNVDGNENGKKVIGFYQQNKSLHLVEQKRKESVNRLSLHRRCFLLLFKNRQARERIKRARASAERENINPRGFYFHARASRSL